MRFPSVLLLASALVAPFARAAGGTLFTNSISYCSESRAVVVDALNIAYHQDNQSVSFSFSFASVEEDLNVSANIYINAYGMDILNETLNLCDILGGVLCPLPQVNFTGYGTYPIPPRFTSGLPGIAYTVPDLEAYAVVQFIRTDNNAVAACLQATLSNGHTTKHKAVAIASGVFTLVALLVGLFHSALSSPSPAQYRWFDILYLYQTAVSAGLLHLNYPLAFSRFVQNFAWSFGLFHSSTMQNSINSMRTKTGGSLDGAIFSDVEYINREFSPYNTVPNSLDVTNLLTFDGLTNIFSTLPKANANAPALVSRAEIPTTLYSTTASFITGIPTYVNNLGIPLANAYTTIFFFFLAFIGIAIVFHILLFVVVFIVDRAAARNGRLGWATRLRRMWWDFCGGNALRICLIWFLPIWIFGFFQFRIGDSKLAIFFAALGLALTFIPLAVVFVLSILKARKPSSTAPTISPLYTSYRWFHSVGVLYRAFRPKYHFFWFAPYVLAMITRSAFIAFGPNQPWAQVIGNVVVEVIVFVLLIACRPHKDKKGDWLAPFLCFVRMVAFGLLIAFIPSVGVDPIPRTVIGIVEIAVFGIPTVLLFLGLIFNAGYGYLWRRHTYRIEDGLEVERFIASDSDSQDRAAMTQNPDKSFATGLAGDASRHDSNPSVNPSLQRRTSVMEPVDDVYGNDSARNSRWSDGPSNMYNYSNDYDNSASAYRRAAEGRHGDWRNSRRYSGRGDSYTGTAGGGGNQFNYARRY